MKKSAILLILFSSLALISCNSNNAKADNVDSSDLVDQSTKAPEVEDTLSNITIDGIKQFVCWDWGAMEVTKTDYGFHLSPVIGELELQLKPVGEGVYQEISSSKTMIGQGARFVAKRVGDVTTLTAYNDDMILFSLNANDDLKSFRDKGYKRMLTSKFDPTDDGQVTITEDVMKGPILPDSPDMNYFFIEDGKGDLSDKIRLSPGRFHLAFSPADKGVNLHFCNMYGETGELEVNYDRENTIILRYAKDPGWKWLSTDVLDAGFLIYNFDKPYWQVMLNKLKAIKKPNEVEIWNRSLIENLIKYNDPYTGLESTDQ